MARVSNKPEISAEQFKAVIEYLEQPKATKKAACEMVGIAYNTKRLDNLIQEYKDDVERSIRLRKEKRRTACSPEELVSMIEDYLDGASFEDLSKRFYRSTAYIKHRLELAGALIRVQGILNPTRPPMLPDECVADAFRIRQVFNKEVANQSEYDTWKASIVSEHGNDLLEIYKRAGKFDTKRSIVVMGEKCWIPGYQCLGEVIKEVPSAQFTSYRVQLIHEDKQQYISLPYFEIGSLSHLKSMGVDIDRLGHAYSGTTCMEILNKAIRLGNKRDKS